MNYFLDFALKLFGLGAVVAIAARWLLAQVSAALASYTTANLQQKGAIDARIARLEQLAEEQARLVRVAETIKDEIAASRRSQDNQWAFKKDVYQSLIRLVVDLLRIYATLLAYTPKLKSEDEASAAEAKERIDAARAEQVTKVSEFMFYASLAQIATAREAIEPILDASKTFSEVADGSSPLFEQTMRRKVDGLKVLLSKLYSAGRKDLWDESEPKGDG
jgi:hypothetical protein